MSLINYLLKHKRGLTKKNKTIVYPGLRILSVTPLDAIASTQLPGSFHKDPADRIIVALARRLKVSLMTCDRYVLAYPHVVTVW